MADVLFSNTENISIANENLAFSPVNIDVQETLFSLQETGLLGGLVIFNTSPSGPGFPESVSTNENLFYPYTYMTGPVTWAASDQISIQNESYIFTPYWFNLSDFIQVTEPTTLGANQIRLNPYPITVNETLTFSESNFVKAYPIPISGSDTIIISDTSGSKLWGQISFTDKDTLPVTDFPNQDDEYNTDPPYVWNPELRRSFYGDDTIDLSEILDFVVPLYIINRGDEIRFIESNVVFKTIGKGFNLTEYPYLTFSEAYSFDTTKGGQDTIGFDEWGCLCIDLDRSFDDTVTLTEIGLFWNATAPTVGTPDTNSGSGATFKALIRKTVVESIVPIERGGRSDDAGNLLPDISCCYPGNFKRPVEVDEYIFIYETFNLQTGGSWAGLATWADLDTWGGLD